jgi:hypothetical protein
MVRGSSFSFYLLLKGMLLDKAWRIVGHDKPPTINFYQPIYFSTSSNGIPENSENSSKVTY